MKTKNVAEYRERTVAELERLQGELAREWWKARFDNFTNQLDNTNKIKRARRNIARVKTILTEKKRASAAGQSKE
jgi:large subunit ribosomal protein L29